MPGFYLECFCEALPAFSVIIEDNEKVAYAYLLEESDLIGDVWLYNSVDASHRDENWERQYLPFLNPLEYINDNQFSQIQTEDDVNVVWEIADNDIVHVLIYIWGKLVAKIVKGSKPGWSTLVKKDGPLAMRF